MYILGVQFDKHSGPDAVKQHKLTFTVDETQQSGMYKFLNSVNKGSEILLLIFDTSKEESEIKELVNENTDETKQRLYKRIHAMINDIGSDKNLNPKVIKDSLKQFLIQKKLMIKSTKELDLKGLASAIYFLQTEFNIE